MKMMVTATYGAGESAGASSSKRCRIKGRKKTDRWADEETATGTDLSDVDVSDAYLSADLSDVDFPAELSQEEIEIEMANELENWELFYSSMTGSVRSPSNTKQTGNFTQLVKSLKTQRWRIVRKQSLDEGFTGVYRRTCCSPRAGSRVCRKLVGSNFWGRAPAQNTLDILKE